MAVVVVVAAVVVVVVAACCAGLLCYCSPVVHVTRSDTTASELSFRYDSCFVSLFSMGNVYSIPENFFVLLFF